MNRKLQFIVYIFIALTFLFSSSIDAKSIEKKFNKSKLDISELREFVESISLETISDEFEVDLNDDNKPEKLIGVTCGNGGCEYYCFKNLDAQKYKFIGTIWLHRMGFEVLKTNHNGFNDILSYWHSNAAEGILKRDEFDGKEYRNTVSINIESKLFNILRTTVNK